MADQPSNTPSRWVWTAGLATLGTAAAFFIGVTAGDFVISGTDPFYFTHIASDRSEALENERSKESTQAPVATNEPATDGAPAFYADAGPTERSNIFDAVETGIVEHRPRHANGPRLIKVADDDEPATSPAPDAAGSTEAAMLQRAPLDSADDANRGEPVAPLPAPATSSTAGSDAS